MSNEIQIRQDEKQISAFSSVANFETAQRMAQALAASDLVPAAFKGKTANCLVALEVAQRCNASPMMVMQNLHVIQGRPSWSSTYIIAAINSSGKFAPLRFKVTGDGDQKTCIAWTKDKSGEILESPPVTIAMAKAEGWYGKNGSKWQTMPELMLRYRSAAFFGRLYASEILMGMRSDDEERDIIAVESEVIETKEATTKAAEVLNQKIKKTAVKKAAPQEVVIQPQPETSEVENEQETDQDFI